MFPVFEDHRKGATADGDDLAYAGRLDRLHADRSRRKQPAELHPILIEPDTKRLMPVPRLQALAPIRGDVVSQLNLAVATTNDPFASRQPDHDLSHQGNCANAREPPPAPPLHAR